MQFGEEAGIQTYELYYFFKDLIYLILERGEGRGKKERDKHQCVRDTLTSCLSHAPNWGPGPQPRHVP